MHFNKVAPGRGLEWISNGFAGFRQSPLIWIVQLIIYVAIVMVLSFIPMIGFIATMLLQPVFVGGMMLGCQALEKGEELRIEHLFDGFRQSTQPLLQVGLYTGLAYMAVGLLAALVVGGGAMSVGILGEVTDNDSLATSIALAGALVVGLLAAVLSLPILMATWFAPALVAFRGAAPAVAMKASFSACLGNVLPFTVYGLLVLVLMVLAMIPAGLGLLVLGPTLVASMYASYQDVFGETR